MIRRGTWITLSVFLGLLTFALWWARARPAPSGSAEATPTAEPLWQLDGNEVAGLRVEDLAGGRQVELRRSEGDSWELIRPTGGAVDDAVVEMAVMWLESPPPRGELSPVEDLAVYGLQEPLARVTVSLQDGSTRVLEVGDETPSGTTTYVRLPGSGRVVVVSKYGLSQVLSLVDDAYTPTETPMVEAPAGTPTAE
ncbi:MAG: DUF4340 domain-containing protein [Chloroflexota bacterium]